MAKLRSLPLPFLLLFVLLPFSRAEIKNLQIRSDTRSSILFEKFGFNHRGTVSIALSEAAFPSADPSMLGFFLLSDESLFQAIYESQNNGSPENYPGPNPSCVLNSPYVKLLFTFTELSAAGTFNKSYPVTHPDEYSLFFASCAPDTTISMNVHTEMFNIDPDGTKNYLSVGQSAVPTIYTVSAIAYFVFLAAWLYLSLIQNRLTAHRIHHLMSGLLLVRSLYLLSAAEDQHYIRVTGLSHGWDVAFYLFQLLKGVLLFAVIVLIGTGWSFLKPFLQDKEKKVLMVVIPLQVVANIASAVIGETGPFIMNYVTWNQIFLFVDVACCCAVLFPIVWSIRTLRETSKTDGKAARNLAKLTLFRQFYMVVIGYLYFTRIIVYALKTIASYKYRWVSVAAEEAVTLAFYLYMFYMFRPVERNQYFVLDEDEEEAAELALREEEFEL
ncbi:Lung seven transmembrane receptor family protein [Rhynchospora pubera]|uniref:Lung seven transmembrane receptor family protein n=1 Tax=Rhynchospora pubera TaxID=906938 RepID=A0AAV8DLA5_9POAL|nr:Lung seven transmembrane receptor family protein [Rhynchospora pubera]